MAFDLLTGKQDDSKNFACEGDFTSNAREAMAKKPAYFVWWYTAKSIGLGVAVGVIGFLAGRESMRSAANFAHIKRRLHAR